MLSKTMYTNEYIQQLNKQTGYDPMLLEKAIYAFGLLEALQKSGLSFIFKGGTALMLLIDDLKRLSTDVDIIVPPDTDISTYFSALKEIFPFERIEEDRRDKKSNIEKRHFKFEYVSSLTGRQTQILLDVLYEEDPYKGHVSMPIKNSLLITEGDDLMVRMPDVNCILGDKLTAFAPHTIGVLLDSGKELEVVKQLFDCGTLFDVMTDYSEVKDTYNHIASLETSYRGNKYSTQDVLSDTITSSVCIAARGEGCENDYKPFREGIRKIQNHIIRPKFTGEVAGAYASRILYLAASLLTGQDTLEKIEDASVYSQYNLEINRPKRFSYIRFSDLYSYGYLIEAIDLLKSAGYSI